MLLYRKIDYNKDVPQIVDLLNANFETEHTAAGFLWKHYENPFGRSYGLLAVDNNEIVGLRMFMRWEFLDQGKVVKALRPVDTCTDLAYRGKGLFKKLTLQGLENIKDEYALIFNTPNSISRPGYLKMGWETVVEPVYSLGFLKPVGNTTNFRNISSSEIDFRQEWNSRTGYQTRLSREFIEWRYADKRYYLAEFDHGGLLIYKLIKLKSIRTFVLVDVLGKKEDFTVMVRSVTRKNAAPVVYLSNRSRNRNIEFLFRVKRNSQVVVSKDDELAISRKIDFSEGDLEGTL